MRGIRCVARCSSVAARCGAASRADSVVPYGDSLYAVDLDIDHATGNTVASHRSPRVEGRTARPHAGGMPWVNAERKTKRDHAVATRHRVVRNDRPRVIDALERKVVQCDRPKRVLALVNDLIMLDIAGAAAAHDAHIGGVRDQVVVNLPVIARMQRDAVGPGFGGIARLRSVAAPFDEVACDLKVDPVAPAPAAPQSARSMIVENP